MRDKSLQILTKAARVKARGNAAILDFITKNLPHCWQRRSTESPSYCKNERDLKKDAKTER